MTVEEASKKRAADERKAKRRRETERIKHLSSQKQATLPFRKLAEPLPSIGGGAAAATTVAATLAMGKPKKKQNYKHVMPHDKAIVNIWDLEHPPIEVAPGFTIATQDLDKVGCR